MSNAKRMALPGLFVALFALALCPVLMSPGPAVAQTPQRADLFGSGLQEGDEVVALIDGVMCEDSHTVAAEDGGWWDIGIALGDCGGGAVDGARITLTVNGVTADQYVTWTDGYFPSDRANGIVLTFASGGGSVSADPAGPPLTATLSRTQGLAIFSGGSLDELEAAALAACPGGVTIVPTGIPLVNVPFRGAYGGGFDGPEPVIVNQCVTTAGS